MHDTIASSAARTLRLAGLATLAVAMLAACSSGVSSEGASIPAASSSPSAPLAIAGSAPAAVVSGSAYSFTPSVSGGNGTLAFSIQNRPAWAKFDPATGTLAGAPTATDRGVYAGIAISVSDGQATASLGAFSIEVVAIKVNGAPIIAGTPTTSILAGSAYSFSPIASDPDGDAMSFTIQGRPSWATFDTGTGALTGTPTDAQVGVYSGITIGVSDGQATASLPAFSIEVRAATLPPANGAPNIVGNPATTVAAGSAYSFTPTASDPNGDALIFAIRNRPSWASFNTSTGQLSGTPNATAAGTYANIQITVSDGVATATLPPFAIVVTAVATGTSTLSWTAPTQNTDGSPLVNLAGFRIYSGRAATALGQTADIGNPSVSTFVVGNLAAGTWYFAVTAYNSAGVESDLSTVVSKTIN
jgi:hypothetical protein